jgi:hypothetical protein
MSSKISQPKMNCAFSRLRHRLQRRHYRGVRHHQRGSRHPSQHPRRPHSADDRIAVFRPRRARRFLCRTHLTVLDRQSKPDRLSEGPRRVYHRCQGTLRCGRHRYARPASPPLRQHRHRESTPEHQVGQLSGKQRPLFARTLCEKILGLVFCTDPRSYDVSAASDSESRSATASVTARTSTQLRVLRQVRLTQVQH